jgi:hypothetical protein
MAEVEGAIRLSDFIADLRHELELAQQDAAGKALKLGVDQITMTLDVGFSKTASGEVSAKGSGRFLVFLSAEAAVKAAASGEWSRSHSVTLTLKPHFEETVVLPGGQEAKVTRSLDVGGELAPGEENPSPPPAAP